MPYNVFYPQGSCALTVTSSTLVSNYIVRPTKILTSSSVEMLGGANLYV